MPRTTSLREATAIRDAMALRVADPVLANALLGAVPALEADALVLSYPAGVAEAREVERALDALGYYTDWPVRVRVG